MRSVCLYCGSRTGTDPAHGEMARRFGRAVADAGLRLVYGAGDHGLMGEAARAAQAGGASVLGFIPRHLVAKELARREIDHLVITETMHERKALMLANSDAVVALAGGPGTLDELIEAVTWASLGLHAKPVLLVNAGGYWDPLLQLFERMGAEGFLHRPVGALVTVVATPEEAVALAVEAAAAAPRSG